MPPTRKPEWTMPRPPAVVQWMNAPGVPPSYAVVTAYGRHAVDLMIFPPDSRIGTPKSGVRYVLDPRNAKTGFDPDAGVWDYTDESKQLRELAALVRAQGTPSQNPPAK